MLKLPPVDTVVERNRLDCKKQYDGDAKTRRQEMAKDVASLANSNGGFLLVGSIEKGGVLKHHEGVTLEEAGQLLRDFGEAVRDRLTPRPTIEFPDPVKLENGKMVFIVEVQPYPGQPVGLQVGDGDGKSWTFPVRSSTNTVWFDPVEMVALMDVQHRRKVQVLYAAMGHDVLIEQVDVPDRVGLPGSPTLKATIDDIDDLGTSVQIRDVQAGGELWIPVDSIDTLWDCRDYWGLRLDGALMCAESLNGDNDGPLMYFIHRSKLESILAHPSENASFNFHRYHKKRDSP